MTDKIDTKQDPKQTKILIVEDNATARLALSFMLQAMGYKKLDIASTGKKAVNMASENRYDLILMDIGLPDIDGIEATRQIKKIPQNNTVVIIAVTGHAKDTCGQECLAVGINEVISKPFTQEELKGVLQKYKL